MAIEFHKIWVEQCEAARGIKESIGTEQALGYLIGEKLLNFLDASTTRPVWAAEIPAFVEEIKTMFEQYEIAHYLETVKRVGALGHTCSDEEHEVFRAAKADAADNPISAAESILLLEQAKELLVDATEQD